MGIPCEFILPHEILELHAPRDAIRVQPLLQNPLRRYSYSPNDTHAYVLQVADTRAGDEERLINLHEARRANLTAGMMALWVGKLMCEGIESQKSLLTSNTALMSPIEEDSLSESGSIGYSENTLENASSMFIDACLTPIPQLDQECFKRSRVKRPVCKTAAKTQFKKQLSRQGYNRMAHTMVFGVAAIKIPPAVKVLFNNWEAQYRADPQCRTIITDSEPDPTSSKKKCFSNALGYTLVVLEVL